MATGSSATQWSSRCFSTVPIAAARSRAGPGAATPSGWPGLSDTPDADLLVTTDYRSVLAEVVTRRFGVSVAQVFPGFAPQAVGVMA
jgi:hypothetical protein